MCKIDPLFTPVLFIAELKTLFTESCCCFLTLNINTIFIQNLNKFNFNYFYNFYLTFCWIFSFTYGDLDKVFRVTQIKEPSLRLRKWKILFSRLFLKKFILGFFGTKNEFIGILSVSCSCFVIKKIRPRQSTFWP